MIVETLLKALTEFDAFGYGILFLFTSILFLFNNYESE